MKKSLSAIIIGSGINSLIPSICKFDVSTVCVIDDPKLTYYVRDTYRDMAKALIAKYDPLVILFFNSTQGIELAGSVAASLKKGLVTGCSWLEVDGEGNLVIGKPFYGGQFSLTFTLRSGRPQMVTLLPGYFEVEERESPASPKIIEETMDLDMSKPVPVVESVIKGNPKTVDISEAEVVVAGGKGVGSPEGFKMIHQLSEVVGGSVAGSRVAVDKGWITSDRQIGQTGKTISPELFISFGISGAIQFKMGMKDSRVIIANDINRSAPILKLADVALVGDLQKMRPALIDEIKRRKVSDASSSH
jgi:electron transfer flavoprotein alpha subunit